CVQDQVVVVRVRWILEKVILGEGLALAVGIGHPLGGLVLGQGQTPADGGDPVIQVGDEANAQSSALGQNERGAASDNHAVAVRAERQDGLRQMANVGQFAYSGGGKPFHNFQEPTFSFFIHTFQQLGAQP